MNEEKSRRFWLGNAILGLALVVLLFMGRLAEWLGLWAMVLWTVLAIAGAYLLMTDRNTPQSPD